MKVTIKRINPDRLEFALTREDGSIEKGACYGCGIRRITENKNIGVTWLN